MTRTPEITEAKMNNGEMKIEKGIPIPSPAMGPGFKSRWSLFAVGDSAFFAGATATGMSGMSMHAKRNDKKFTRRTVTENGVRGIRVWRVR